MIYVVVPTIREEQFKLFTDAWAELFEKHNVHLVVVKDGDHPTVNGDKKIYDKYKSVVNNRSDVVRNLGFLYLAESYVTPNDIIITLDDDVYPIGDPIQGHIDVLDKRLPISWFSHASEYMRGFPYGIRDEAEVVVSHGVWDNIFDYDAPTQLVNGNPHASFYKGAVPRGCLFTFCGMNVAFKARMLPQMFFAPMNVNGIDRFGDIWLGVTLKRYCDTYGLAIATGYSKVYHSKASNVFMNLKKEAIGIGLNETFWKGDETDPYFKIYREKKEKYEKLIKSMV